MTDKFPFEALMAFLEEFFNKMLDTVERTLKLLGYGEEASA